MFSQGRCFSHSTLWYIIIYFQIKSQALNITTELSVGLLEKLTHMIPKKIDTYASNYNKSENSRLEYTKIPLMPGPYRVFGLRRASIEINAYASGQIETAAIKMTHRKRKRLS